ncbi:MAG: DUF4118 domain-containing protein, partial [Anaerolineales bacterium]|nr:DUF4118 domain-containing protein [Anaerolineales bacterium]
MRDYMETRAIPGPWPAGERLLVCVSPGALSERLVRTACRLADELKAEWFAVYVETPDDIRLPREQHARVARMLHLAEELGAKTLTLPGQNVAETILDYARSHNVTKVIAGKHVRSRLGELWHRSVVDQIIAQSGNINVYVISGETPIASSVNVRALKPTHSWQYYLISAALVAGITLLGFPIASSFSPVNLAMLYLTVVVITALYLGRGPSILASILGVLAFDFFFVPPQLTFAVADSQYILTFAGLLIVGLVISTLAARVREQVNMARQRELQSVELYELSRDLASAIGRAEILQAVISHISQTFSREVVVFLPEGDTLKPRAHSAEM